MQDLHPLADADFISKAKEPINRLDIYIECCPIDLCNFYGENYLISADYSKGQKEQTYRPLAASFSAVIDNTEGLFHPKNTDSPFWSYLKVGRRMMFYTGFKVDGNDHLWKWFEGVISEVTLDTVNKQIKIQGFDYMQYLTDKKLKSPDNYWGTSELISTVEDQAEYSLNAACKGAYIAYLDGDPIYNEKHWAYDRVSNELVFLPDYVPAADGVNNLEVYYFTSQVPENVIADLLVSGGRYPTQEAALANMEYTATGITIDRVWFATGLNLLTAIQKVCERVDYQFFFDHNGVPHFEPIQEIERWENRLFTFTKDLISDPAYDENSDEVKNRIVIEGEAYSALDKFYKIICGDDLLDDTITDRHIAQVVCEEPYEHQALVSASQDIIVPFYIPNTMLAINYVYLNLYFPGLQDGDYPDNTATFYHPHYYATSKTMNYQNGVVVPGFYVPYRLAGNGADGANYDWYRWFFKFDITPYHGFKLNACSLRWALDNIVKAGAGANTQISMELDGLGDYEMLLNADWGAAVSQAYGVVNVHDDVLGNEFNKDVKVWAQAQLDAGVKGLCFRMKGVTEHVDVNNAVQYYTSNHQLLVTLEEDATASVDVKVDNGAGFGAAIGSYSTDQEDLDLTAHFTGTGKKQLKFECAMSRRIDVLIRIGLTLDRA